MMKIKTYHNVTMMVMILMMAGMACQLGSQGEEAAAPLDTQQPEPTATTAPAVIEVQLSAVPEPLRQWEPRSTRGMVL